MITPLDIIRVRITPGEVGLLEQMAARFPRSMPSQFREHEDRQARFEEDQLVGMVATYAYLIHQFGRPLGSMLYRTARWAADRAPKKGDGGTDVPGANVDVKGSKLYPNADPLRYRLPVRPYERHAETIYVLALVEWPIVRPACVQLIGWTSEESLPSEPENEGPFKGAYTLPASLLQPLMPLQWWRNQ